MLLRSNSVGNGRITGVQRLMDGGSIPPSSTSCIIFLRFQHLEDTRTYRSLDPPKLLGKQASPRIQLANTPMGIE